MNHDRLRDELNVAACLPRDAQGRWPLTLEDARALLADYDALARERDALRHGFELVRWSRALVDRLKASGRDAPWCRLCGETWGEAHTRVQPTCPVAALDAALAHASETPTPMPTTHGIPAPHLTVIGRPRP